MPLSRNNLGQSKFPPNPKQWDAERNGLALRAQFGRPLHAPLGPFEVARAHDGIRLLDRPEFEELVGARCACTLFGEYRDAWSGFVVPVDGTNVIVVNATHPPTRQNATLTEELFHIRLEHAPCTLSRCPITGLMNREYTRSVEHDAYWSAGAALVPYVTLRELVRSGTNAERIAELFDVSVPLVHMRMKLTKLWRSR